MLFLLFKVYWKYTLLLNNFKVAGKNARIVNTKKFICSWANKEQIITYMMPHHPNTWVCISYTEGHVPTWPHRAIQIRKLTSIENHSPMHRRHSDVFSFPSKFLQSKSIQSAIKNCIYLFHFLSVLHSGTPPQFFRDFMTSHFWKITGQLFVNCFSASICLMLPRD